MDSEKARQGRGDGKAAAEPALLEVAREGVDDELTDYTLYTAFAKRLYEKLVNAFNKLAPIGPRRTRARYRSEAEGQSSHPRT